MRLFYALLLLCFTSPVAAQTWEELPGTAIDTVCPGPQPDGWGRCANIINAWGDGALDIDESVFYVTGGGGGDYSGNEVYRIPLDGSPVEIFKPQSDLPADIADCPLAWQDPDGTGPAPPSSHTYGNLAYIPANATRPDPLLLWQDGARAGCDKFNQVTWILNLTTREYTNLGEIGPPRAMRCTYSAARDTAICIYSASGWLQVKEFDPDTNVWNGIYSGTSILNVNVEPGRGAAWVDATQTWWLLGSGLVASFHVPTLTYTEHITTNGSVIVNSDDPGFAYHPGRDTLIAWNSSDATVPPENVYELDRSTFDWTTHVGTGAPPLTHDNAGVYGRWKYVASLDKMAALPATNQDAYLFSFSETPTFSATATQIPWQGDEWPCGDGVCKHIRLQQDPATGYIYTLGGDYGVGSPSGTSGRGFNQSGRNEQFRYDPVTRFWELVHEYCPTDRRVIPSHPDEMGWWYDDTRSIYWAVPGFQFGNGACSVVEGTATGGDTTTLIDSGAVFTTLDIQPGDYVFHDGVNASFQIQSIDSDTQITFSESSPQSWSGVIYKVTAEVSGRLMTFDPSLPIGSRWDVVGGIKPDAPPPLVSSNSGYTVVDPVGDLWAMGNGPGMKRYEPDIDTWTTGFGSGDNDTVNDTRPVILNGKIYKFAFCDDPRKTWIFDLASRTWSFGSAPPEMLTCGGVTSGGRDFKPIYHPGIERIVVLDFDHEILHLYDPVTDSWELNVPLTIEPAGETFTPRQMIYDWTGDQIIAFGSRRTPTQLFELTITAGGSSGSPPGQVQGVDVQFDIFSGGSASNAFP